MISLVTVKKYCKDYKNIENYDLAMNDTTQVWECHHRLETETSDGEIRPRKAQLGKEELIALDMYWNRPSNEFIFLSRKEHSKIHRIIESNEDFGSAKEDKKSYEKARNKVYYEANKDSLKEYSKAYRDNHKDDVKEYNEDYYKNHREEIKARQEKNITHKNRYNKINIYIKRNGKVHTSLLPKTWSTEDIEYYKERVDEITN